MLVKLWDTKTGKVLFTLDNHEGKEVYQPSNIFNNNWPCSERAGDWV